MSNNPSQERDSFVGLTSFHHVSGAAKSLKSSLVKSTCVKNVGDSKIEVIDGCGAEPSVLVHKLDEKIVKIEFQCSCGKSTHLDLEYDAE
jgi:hypothetical protein